LRSTWGRWARSSVRGAGPAPKTLVWRRKPLGVAATGTRQPSPGIDRPGESRAGRPAVRRSRMNPSRGRLAASAPAASFGEVQYSTIPWSRARPESAGSRTSQMTRSVRWAIARARSAAETRTTESTRSTSGGCATTLAGKVSVQRRLHLHRAAPPTIARMAAMLAPSASEDGHPPACKSRNSISACKRCTSGRLGASRAAVSSVVWAPAQSPRANLATASCQTVLKGLGASRRAVRLDLRHEGLPGRQAHGQRPFHVHAGARRDLREELRNGRAPLPLGRLPFQAGPLDGVAQEQVPCLRVVGLVVRLDHVAVRDHVAVGGKEKPGAVLPEGGGRDALGGAGGTGEPHLAGDLGHDEDHRRLDPEEHRRDPGALTCPRESACSQPGGPDPEAESCQPSASAVRWAPARGPGPQGAAGRGASPRTEAGHRRRVSLGHQSLPV
jgi:hypothetical protein